MFEIKILPLAFLKKQSEVWKHYTTIIFNFPPKHFPRLSSIVCGGNQTFCVFYCLQTSNPVLVGHRVRVCIVRRSYFRFDSLNLIIRDFDLRKRFRGV